MKMSSADAVFGTDPTRRNAGDGEPLLAEYLQHLSERRAGRRVVHITLARHLSPFRRAELASRITWFFATLVTAMQAELFMLRNDDILLFFRIEDSGVVESVLAKIDSQLADGPWAGRDMSSAFAFATIDFERNPEQVAALLSLPEVIPAPPRMPEDASDRRRDRWAGVRADPRPGRDSALTLPSLARLEAALAQTDVSGFVRSHTVCNWVDDGPPTPCFTELTISIPDLAAQVLPGVDLQADPWLFRHLTETLDRRMLAMLVKPDSHGSRARTSINLNIATLLSPEFLSFDERMFAARRGTIVIELKAADVFSDLETYHLVRRFLQARRYQICIDGMNCCTVALIDRHCLGADWVKVDFTGELFDSGTDAWRRLSAVVAHNSAERVILARVETGQVVMLGRKAGVRKFQGSYVNHALRLTAARPGGSLDRAVR